MHQEVTDPLPAGPAEDSGRGSSAAAVMGGIAIPAAAAPLVAVALPVALLLSWWILGELLGREIGWHERRRGGMQMLAGIVAAMAVGTIATALAGVPMVKYLFRRARPDLLFRVGAVGLFLVAAAFWLWSIRSHPDYRFTAAWIALLGWLGSLLGLRVATWETEESKRRNDAEDALLAEQRNAEAEALLREMSIPSEPTAPGPGGEGRR